MKRLLHIIIILVSLVLIVAGCNTSPDNRKAQSNDTLYTAEAAIKTFYQDPTQALAILDSAEAVGNVSKQQADIVRARIYSDDESTTDTARTICTQLLGQGNLTKEQKLDVLDVLVYVSRMRRDDEGILKYGMQYIEVCRQQGKESQALLTQSEIGEALIRLGRTEEGFAKMDDAIAQLDQMCGFEEMDACVRAMKSKMRTLIELDRYEEIIPVAERIIEKMNDYGEHPDSYNDGSKRIPPEERRPGYIDFYTGQAYAFMAYAYAMMAGNRDTQSILNTQNNPKAAALRCLALFEQTGYSKTFDGKKLISGTWCQLGMYDKMLAFYDEKDRVWGGDTLHRDYAVTLYNRATAARAYGNFRASDAYMRRYTNVIQQLNNREHMAAAQEYAARYHEQEQQLAMEKERAKARNGRTLAVAGFLLTILSIGFIIWLLIQRRATERKNRVLVEQIAEAMKYKKVLNEQYSADGVAAHNQSKQFNTKHLPSNADEFSDEQLFSFLSEAIRRERLFTDPRFGRQTLVDKYNLTERRIGAAFARGSEHNSLPDFVRELRIEYACQLLADRPDLSIGEVGSAAGFSSPTVFSREFKRKLDVTPTYYRQQMSSRL